MERLSRKTEPPRGVLLDGPRRPRPGAPVELRRFQPPPDLAPYVEHFWIVRWDLRGREPKLQETLPHPSIHWVTEARRTEIVGIVRGRFTRVLAGAGRVVAVKFRPGGFCAFTDQALHTFTNRRVPARAILGAVTRNLAEEIRAPRDEAAVRRLCAVLRAAQPKPDDAAARAGALVAEIARDAGITSVARLGDRASMSPLALQRLFRAKIGVSPKWVIQRYRLHEALERIHAAADNASSSPSPPSFPSSFPSWAALAADLGFTDQAHFARTFKAFVGVPPGEYVRRLEAALRAA